MITQSDIEDLEEACYVLRGYVNNKYFEPNDVHPAQRSDYKHDMEVVEDALKVIDKIRRGRYRWDGQAWVPEEVLECHCEGDIPPETEKE